MNPIFLAILAYGWWGFVPLYWKLLAEIPAEELILYRILFSSLFLLLLFYPPSRRQELAALLKNRRVLAGLFVSGCLIGFNWFLYVWAVNNNYVVESSLGYFINPLVNVALGTLFLGESMRRPQKVACGLAFLGVTALTFATGTLPWIALLLAFSFAFYGLVRKMLRVATIAGTFLETIILAAPSAAILLWLGPSGAARSAASLDWALISLSGVVTTIPLLAFAEAAKTMPLSVLGFFQFISPSIQFLLGVFLFREPFGLLQWLSFALIWCGLAVFVGDLLSRRRT